MNRFSYDQYELQSSNGSNVFLTKDDIYTFQDADEIGTVPVGRTIGVGDQEYVVLEHGSETTALWGFKGNSIISQMTAGYSPDDESYKMFLCRPLDYFLNVLNSRASTRINIPPEYIVPHTVKYAAENGERPKKFPQQNISLLTADQYRRYKHILPYLTHEWWLMTPTCGMSFNKTARENASIDELREFNEICYVRSDGRIGWAPPMMVSYFAHPFLIVKSKYKHYECCDKLVENKRG